MEEQLSLIDLVLQASFTVQAVMGMLMLASVLSWYMIVQRFLYFRSARDEMYDFEERFWSGIDLSQLYREGNERASEGAAAMGMESIFRAGFKEFSRLAQQSDMDSEAVLEGSRRAMRVLSQGLWSLFRHPPGLARQPTGYVSLLKDCRHFEKTSIVVARPGPGFTSGLGPTTRRR